MDLDEAIKGRRSIRVFKSDDIPVEHIESVLEAATFAPSAKNGQQWRFTILRDEAKDKFTDWFMDHLLSMRKKHGDTFMGSAIPSCEIMNEAPVSIIVWNTNEFGWLTEHQSVAAAIQNMLLKAYSLGIGSLWIGDIFYAERRIPGYFNKSWALAAAVVLGWPAENPGPRPRLSVDEVAEFL
ncbi:MAG: nitroreductase family protein [Candidatus Thorarchaeota archaeon]|nr:MAG: nitroreductase family protein [Candidatus Thorarchaeota archaeon]